MTHARARQSPSLKGQTQTQSRLRTLRFTHRSQTFSAIAIAAAFLSLAASAGAGTQGKASGQVRYRNCAALNRVFPHGVGRVGARDKTTGVPVTTFKRSNALYIANEGRDRDKDGIACEQA